MTAYSASHPTLTSFSEDESEFLARFQNSKTQHNHNNNNTIDMPKSSSDHSHLTEPTVAMSDFNLVDCNGSNFTRSSSCSTGSRSSNSSGLAPGQNLANAFETAEQESIEAPFHMTPYVVEEKSPEQYVKQLDRKMRSQNGPRKNMEKPQSQGVAPNTNRRRISKRIPKVTSASVPFQKTIPPTSFLRDELAKDPAYTHALRAGTLWQSLVGQHVKLPALWYDGEEPARPYLGCEDPLKRNKWSYFGRHRVAGDPKLNTLVKHSRSSGKLLLHIVCRDSHTLEPTEDVVVGVFHPNADGIREGNSTTTHHRNDGCRDVWIGHRSRSVPHQGRRIATRIESLLRYLHKNKVDQSPLGMDVMGNRSKRSVNNTNMNQVFGSRPPRHTVFVTEQKLYDILEPQANEPPVPASVMLLRAFLR